MTNDEKKVQKAQLLVECDEALNDLAHLRERAIRISDDIRRVADWMEANATDDSSPFNETFSRPEDAAIRTDPRYQSAMDFSAHLRLTGEIKTARQKLWNLDRRKKALGIGV